MADFWKSIDLNKFVVKDDMIDYVLHKYWSNWQIYDAIADDILDDLMKRKWEKQQRGKYKCTRNRISRVGKHLKKAKEKMYINRGKEKMVMERVSSDDTLKSRSEDTCSSDSTWEQKKKLLKIVQWYDDLSSDEQRTVYKGRVGSSSRNAAITKLDKPKSNLKHLAPTIPRTWSTYTTLIVPTKRPPLVTNCVLGLVAVTTWQQIMNREFGIKRSK
ncbi:hypothetical protein Tco_0701283 [Tanacetum coccineum]